MANGAHLLTGHQATNHISAFEESIAARAQFSASNCVLGNEDPALAIEVTSGTLRITSMVALFSGRKVVLEGAETSYTLPSSASTFRRVAVGITYTKNASTGVEECSFSAYSSIEKETLDGARAANHGAPSSSEITAATTNAFYELWELVVTSTRVALKTETFTRLITYKNAADTLAALVNKETTDALHLATRITNEQTDRKNADTALSGRISTLESWKTNETNRQFVELEPASGEYQGYKWYGNSGNINRNDVILFIATYKENNTNYWQASFLLDMKQLTDNMVTNDVRSVNGPVISVRGGNRQRIELQVQQASASACCYLHVKTAETYRWMIYGGTTEVHGYLNQVYNVPYSKEIEEGEAPTSIKVYRVRRVGE